MRGDGGERNSSSSNTRFDNSVRIFDINRYQAIRGNTYRTRMTFHDQVKYCYFP